GETDGSDWREAELGGWHRGPRGRRLLRETRRGPSGEAPDDERQGVQRVPQPDSRGTEAPPFSQGIARKSRSRGAEGLEFADFLARNHDALDLGRPFPYLKDLRIPHPLLHGLVLHVAGPSEDLDGVRGDFHRDVRREQFRHARL